MSVSLSHNRRDREEFILGECVGSDVVQTLNKLDLVRSDVHPECQSYRQGVRDRQMGRWERIERAVIMIII